MLADASLQPAFPHAAPRGKPELALALGVIRPATDARPRAEPTAHAALFRPSPRQVAVRRRHRPCGCGYLRPPPPIQATFLNRSRPLLQSKFSRPLMYLPCHPPASFVPLCLTEPTESTDRHRTGGRATLIGP